MRKILSIKLPAILVSTAFIASCGGGGTSSGQEGTPATNPSTVTAAATFGDCFIWTPGVKYTRTDGSKILLVQEQFEGQTAISNMELRADDTRFGGAYLTVDNAHVQILGVNQYDSNGVFDGKDVNSSGNRLPVNMTPGQTVQLDYTQTSTSLTPTSSTTTTTETDRLTFVGFENLTLGGRTFANVCRIKSPNPNGTETSVTWAANGFGFIRSETQDAQGATVPGTRNELATIVTAP
jgi:hypothetical protein